MTVVSKTMVVGGLQRAIFAFCNTEHYTDPIRWGKTRKSNNVKYSINRVVSQPLLLIFAYVTATRSGF